MTYALYLVMTSMGKAADVVVFKPPLLRDAFLTNIFIDCLIEYNMTHKSYVRPGSVCLNSRLAAAKASSANN